MRFSVDSASPHWHPAVMHMTVRLNGVKLTNAIEVDDVAGTVRIQRFDPCSCEYVTETRRGVVRIEVPHEHSTHPGYAAIPAKYIGRPLMPQVAGILRVR